MNEDMDQKILKYLEGEMSNDEKLEFEKDITQNIELQKKIALYRDVDRFLEADSKLNVISERVKNVHELYKEQQHNRKRIYLTLKAAASIALLFGVFTLIKFITTSPSRMFNKNYTAYSISESQRDASMIKEYDEWFDNYNKGYYKLVVDTYNTLPESQKLEAKTVLYYSCALMELNKYEDALNALQKVNVEDNLFINETFIWYKALCYLKLDDKFNAQQAFIILAKSNTYGEKATDILKKLE